MLLLFIIQGSCESLSHFILCFVMILLSHCYFMLYDMLHYLTLCDIIAAGVSGSDNVFTIIETIATETINLLSSSYPI